MTYKIKSSAIRAAKKVHGNEYLKHVTIVEVDGQFDIQLIQSAPAIPATPFNEAVTIPAAPVPTPALPAFLQTPPPAPEAVAQAQGDALADAALVAPRIGHKVCPNCGSEELYRGEADPTKALTVINEDFIEGCHNCEWEVDTRKVVNVRPRTSVVPLPTKLVWAIADEMVAAAKAAGQPAPKRKEVIEECVRRGVAYGTARTQYQHWFKCIADQACAPLATINGDGSITMNPGK